MATEGHNVHSLIGKNHIRSSTVVQKKETGFGVAFVVEGTMKRDVFGFKALGERIYILRITTNFLNLSFNRYTLFQKKGNRNGSLSSESGISV